MKEILETFGVKQREGDDKVTVNLRQLIVTLTAVSLAIAGSVTVASYKELPGEVLSIKKDVRVLQDYQIKTEARWEQVQQALGRIERNTRQRPVHNRDEETP